MLLAGPRLTHPASSSPVRQIPALTSIRGIAAWWVVLYHFREHVPVAADSATARLMAHGYLAVDLFFILSGFVIALNYTAMFGTLAVKNYTRFLGLRLARIYPLHITVLLAFLINPLAVLLFSDTGRLSLRYDPLYYVLSLFLMQNWGFTHLLAWNVPAWSISTEWAAYLLFPLLAWQATRLRGAAGAAGVMAGALALLMAGAALSVPSLGADIPTFGLFRCITEFAAGAGLFWLGRHLPAAMRGCGSAALLAAALLAATAVIWPEPDFLVFPPAFLLLVFGLSREPGWTVRLLGWRPLEFLGTVSYSTYLLHDFVRDWVKFLLLRPGVPAWLVLAAYLAGTAVASVLAYRMIELPGRRSLRALLDGRSRTATVAVRPYQTPAGRG